MRDEFTDMFVKKYLSIPAGNFVNKYAEDKRGVWCSDVSGITYFYLVNHSGARQSYEIAFATADAGKVIKECTEDTSITVPATVKVRFKMKGAGFRVFYIEKNIASLNSVLMIPYAETDY
ncbi:MAG: hypothetical protein A2096_02505 [Spirochaetes bacterium GWF1_41_5]|nr:MAG: hypothetical protein A2096_02505 [Spirochaetes bacterium GWF1_41_5]HBE04537.1 hypothetical protein [Spirochaetia bacterium]